MNSRSQPEHPHQLPQEADRQSEDGIAHGSADGRRTFLAVVTALFAGAATILVPLISGILFLASPLRRSARSPEDDADANGFIPIALSASSLPTDGTPRAACVRRDCDDAWNHLPSRAVGTVWVHKDSEGEVVAHSSICPHLGCAVEFRPAERDFACPCHNSAFSLDGARQNAIPPRDLDRLEAKVVEDVIWVRYQNFRGGIPEKVAT